MYKANIDLFSVRSNFKVKFSLILKEDNQEFNYKKLINKYSISGNEYLQVTPHPFIVFDISNKKQQKENGYSTNDTITFTRKHTFLLLKKINKLLKDFTDPDLFYYEDDVLMVNKSLSEKYKVIHRTNSKTILIQPSVVLDEESGIEYEGAILAINVLDHYTEITYSELQFLYNELFKIDFTSYSLQIINMAELFEKMEASEIKIKPISYQEEKEEEIIDLKKSFKVKDTSEIPEI